MDCHDHKNRSNYCKDHKAVLFVVGYRLDGKIQIREDKKIGVINRKEKVDKILGGFLDRNKEYIVELYIRNTNENSIIGRMYVTTDRTFKADDKKFTFEWDNGEDVMFNSYSVPYGEILACYEEVDEYNQQTVYVLLKCGVSIDFECVGLRG